MTLEPPRPLPDLECRGRLIWDERFKGYDFGPQHPLRPERFVYGLDLLAEAGVWRPEQETLPPESASRAELEAVHSRDYVNTVEWLDDGGPIDPALVARHGLGPGDNPAFPGMHDVSALIAGGTLRAARAIMAGEIDHAFNPAGGLHHAMRDRASGFCIYNDAAVAIAALLREHGLRVLYLDFDAHHGDGVQFLFYDEPRVLTFSIHETGRYLFPGSGEVDELGAGAGLGYSVNAPMEPFTHDSSWFGAVQALVPALAERLRPDFIVSQHGCDGHAWDPLTHLGITTWAIAAQARLAHELAHRYCGGRWIGLGGGGYDYRRVVPRMYALILAQMVNRPLPSSVPEAWRARWATTGSEPLPTTFIDPPSEFGLGPRAADIAQRNAETVDQAREAVLPPPLRHAYPAPWPGGDVPDLAGELDRAPAVRSTLVETARGSVQLRDWASAAQVRQLRPDPGLDSFTGDAERQHTLLERLADLPSCVLKLAHTPDGTLVGYLTLARSEHRWSRLERVWEVGLEISRDWRRLGLARALLDFSCRAEHADDLILVATYPGWRGEQSGEPARAYQDTLRRLFEGSGFEELHSNTSDRLFARVGGRVSEEARAAFQAAARRRSGTR